MSNSVPYQILQIVNTGEEIQVVSDGTVVNLPAQYNENGVLYVQGDGTVAPQEPEVIDISESPEPIKIEKEYTLEPGTASSELEHVQFEGEEFSCWRHMYTKLFLDYVFPLRLQLAGRKEIDEAKYVIYEETKSNFPDIIADPFRWLNSRTEYLKAFHHRLKEWSSYDHLIMENCVNKNLRLSGSPWPKTPMKRQRGKPKKRKLDEEENVEEKTEDEILKNLQDILSGATLSLPLNDVEDNSEIIAKHKDESVLPSSDVEEELEAIPKRVISKRAISKRAIPKRAISKQQKKVEYRKVSKSSWIIGPNQTIVVNDFYNKGRIWEFVLSKQDIICEECEKVVGKFENRDLMIVCKHSCESKVKRPSWIPITFQKLHKKYYKIYSKLKSKAVLIYDKKNLDYGWEFMLKKYKCECPYCTTTHGAMIFKQCYYDFNHACKSIPIAVLKEKYQSLTNGNLINASWWRRMEKEYGFFQDVISPNFVNNFVTIDEEYWERRVIENEKDIIFLISEDDQEYAWEMNYAEKTTDGKLLYVCSECSKIKAFLYDGLNVSENHQCQPLKRIILENNFQKMVENLFKK